MTEEIKEILEYPTIYNFDDEPYLHGTDYVKLRDYITNLQQENEKLKEQLQNKGIIKTCENCEWFGTCPHSYRECDYKSKCEKAIEYCSLYTRLSAKDLLNILNGSDENETNS